MLAAADDVWVRARADELRGQGYDVFVEDQNKFSMKGQAATLGRADLVAMRVRVLLSTASRASGDLMPWRSHLMFFPPLTHAACRARLAARPVPTRACRSRGSHDKLRG
jgi:hypothetical protein